MDNINMLIWYQGDFTAIMETVDANGKVFPYPYVEVSEMVGNTWMLVLQNKDDFDALEVALEADGSDVIIIGTYNMDGFHYEWFGAGNAGRNHTFAKYKEKLNDVIEYDANGDPVGSHPPTDQEALATQVNKVYGWNDRVIE